MNMQEAFDKAYTGIVKQGKIAVDPISLKCVYKTSDGAKCAVGHLLTDEDLNLWKDMNLFHKPIKLIPNDKWPDSIKGLDMWFLQELQRAHDNAIMQ